MKFARFALRMRRAAATPPPIPHGLRHGEPHHVSHAGRPVACVARPEDRLTDWGKFVRVHRSSVVNLEFVHEFRACVEWRLQSLSAGGNSAASEPLLSSQTTNRSSGLAATFEVRAAAACERPSFIDLEIIQWDPAYIPASNRCTSLSGKVDEGGKRAASPFCSFVSTKNANL